MENPVITAFAKLLSPHVALGKSRLETLAMLVLGMVSARTVNLVNIAPERGKPGVRIASTYRRLQRFFQHVRLPQDWAARVIAALVRGPEKRVLVLDRTNWKIGDTEVNILVLAVSTPLGQAPLLWKVLGRAGNSGAPERMELLERYSKLFGKDSIAMLLGDREFIGRTWLNYLIMKDIPFTIRLREKMYVTTYDGRTLWLRSLLLQPRKGRKAWATLTGLKAPLHLVAKIPRRGEPVIVATNRPGHDALQTYRKRWSIEVMFANCKTRGLNLEDTRLTDPAKLDLLTALVAITIAWATRAAKSTLGIAAPPRKSHGYFAKSYFKTGIEFIRHRLNGLPDRALDEWRKLDPAKNPVRVV
jgi:hypothetical protein